MEKLRKEFTININNEEEVERFNKKEGKKKYLTTEEQLQKVMDDIYDLICKCAIEGGAYVDDSIKINVDCEYRPECK